MFHVHVWFPNAKEQTTLSIPPLPGFQTISIPKFVWGPVDAESFCHSLDTVYSEVTHWRRNYFSTLPGSSGKSFVCELARLFHAVAVGFIYFALKALIVLCILLL